MNPEKRYKRIGWVVQSRPGSGFDWIVKYYTFSKKSSDHSWGLYKYQSKDIELAQGDACTFPVYVEVT